MFLIFIILIGCSNKNDNEKLLEEERISNCNKNFYKGKILFGTFANSEESKSSLLQVKIKEKFCIAEINPTKINYETSKLYFTFNQLICDNKEINVKGFVLDYQCQQGIIANHKTNDRLISYLEEQLKIFPSEQLKLKLIKEKMGYLETKSNQEVFILITEPYYFLHKNLDTN